jgi:molecular chaperone HtpG
MCANDEPVVETFAFQAEISQLMSLIINTFYSNKSIFLRELISNSSDALDKIRYQGLTDNSVLTSEPNLFINIIPDKENNILHLEDSGVGMTKADLINNLGTIAKSGTKGFMEALSGGSDMSLIGQFGVGFYSAFLVADSVSVTSKHNDDEQYTWTSNAGGSFNITPDTIPSLKRGTRISLHLKEDQHEFLEIQTIKDLVKTHSEFINYPISLMVEKEREVDSPHSNDELEYCKNDTCSNNSISKDNGFCEEHSEPLASLDEDVEGLVEDVETLEKVEELTVDDTDDEHDKPKDVEKYNELEQLNTNKPIWTRDKEDVSEDEYATFYKGISGDWEDHLAVKHFKAEGQLEFTAILYIPKRIQTDMFNKTKQNNLKLYVRRVFITDKCEEIIPEWLSFMKGIVDSEDLPLNISREILQQSRTMKVIRKNIVKRSIELFQELVEDESKYTVFYEQFSKNIKLGIHEDSVNRDKLSKLLRYNSSNNEEMISLDNYVSNMSEGQEDIYYISGESLDSIKNSSFVKGISNKGYDVLLMHEPIDEYVLQQLTEYDGKKLISITKEGFKLPETEDEKTSFDTLTEEYAETCNQIQELIKDRCEKVVLSNRLTDTPCCIVTGQFGWSANMERIMKAQTLGDKSASHYMMSKKTLEINPYHVIVKELKTKLALEDDTSKKINLNIVNLMYDTALIDSGFTLEQSGAFANRIYNMLAMGLGVEQDFGCEANSEVVNSESLSDIPELEEPQKGEVVEAVEEVVDEMEQVD